MAIRLSPILKANLSRQKIKRNRGAQMGKIQMNRQKYQISSLLVAPRR